MSIPEKIIWTIGALIPLAGIASMTIIPSFMTLEQRIPFERMVDEVFMGVLVIFALSALIVVPAITIIGFIVCVWFGPAPEVAP